MFIRALLFVALTTTFSIANAVECGGDSINKKDLLQKIATLKFGEVTTTETVLLQGMRPPLVYNNSLEVLAPGSQRFEEAKALLDYSRSGEIFETALKMASTDDNHMARYRERCLLDDSSDTEVLSRGVEVMQIAVITDQGQKFVTNYMTLYKPASSNLDFDHFNNEFLPALRAGIKYGEKVKYWEIYHNHPLPDGLSEIDLDFVAAISHELRTKARIIAWMEQDGKLAEIASPFFVNGLMQSSSDEQTAQLDQ